jgi:hypothetical protein
MPELNAWWELQKTGIQVRSAQGRSLNADTLKPVIFFEHHIA